MLLGGAAVTWPLAARAQPAKRLPAIAIVYSVGSVAEMAGVDPLGVNMRALERELRDLGWIDGRTVTIERQSPEGQSQQAAAILAEVVARKPDVILLGGARWLHEAALRATRTVPIVAPFGEDPVPAGFVRRSECVPSTGGYPGHPSPHRNTLMCITPC